MQKIGNLRHVPSLLNPHSPLRLDLLKDKSLPWLSFFLLKAPSPKLIHNAFQSVGVSVFAAGSYVITFIGFWQHRVIFKLRTSHQGYPDFSYPVWTAIMCQPKVAFYVTDIIVSIGQYCLSLNRQYCQLSWDKWRRGLIYSFSYIDYCPCNISLHASLPYTRIYNIAKVNYIASIHQSQQTILWLSWVQYCKIFHSNIVLNRHYCQHTYQYLVNIQYCGSHGYNIVKYFIAI
jgi:hypothetical protein